MAYQKNNTLRHYTLAEMFSRANEVKRLYPSSEARCKCGTMEIILSLKPTDVSIDYKVRLSLLGITVLATYSWQNGLILLFLAYLASPMGLPMFAIKLLTGFRYITGAIKSL